MIIPVKKTLNNTGHIDTKLIDFSEICQKKYSEIGCFLLIVSWRSFPPKISREIGRVFLRNFDFFRYNPWNWPICLRILTFLLRNRPIFPRILIFLPRKSHEIGRFFCEFWLFSHEIDRFFREFAPKNPAKFCFFFREISEALKETSFVRKFDSHILIG